MTDLALEQTPDTGDYQAASRRQRSQIGLVVENGISQKQELKQALVLLSLTNINDTLLNKANPSESN